MRRLLFIFCTLLPLAACSSSAPESLALRAQAEHQITTALISPDQTIQNAAARNGQSDPCPRFIQSLDAAETILDAQPRNYPHML